jgi:aspartyl-tRNA(Asn)/glutamyl-tRNA(Gln) amidotransferase subunit C
MSISIEDVKYIAKLARLRLGPEEENAMVKDLNAILDYMATLNSLDTTDVEPMSHVLDLTNQFRPDRVVQRISHEEALKNAPDADSDYFRVPKVID